MDHYHVGELLIAALSLAGLARLVPLILKEIVEPLERSLAILSRMILICRRWRDQVFVMHAHQTKRVPETVNPGERARARSSAR